MIFALVTIAILIIIVMGWLVVDSIYRGMVPFDPPKHRAWRWYHRRW